MKLKGISFWEQNVEKVFLGVVGVGVLGALAYQYVLQTSAIQVGQETVAPEKSFDPVAKAARELKGKLDSTDPKLPEVPSVDLAQRFEQLATGPVSTVGSNLYPIGKGAKLNVGDITENKGDRVFAEVMVPAPTASLAHAFRSTISPYEVIRSPDIKAILPAEQPFDKAAASVEATFDGTALKAALQADPDGAGPVEPLLASWWRDTEIIGVQLERQLQNSDGSWADAAIVAAMPGRVDLLGDVKTKVKSSGDLPSILAVARSMPDAVQRAPYYATISGVDWKAPSEVADAGSDIPKDERSRLVQRITDLEKAYRKVQDQIADANNKQANNKPRTQQPASSGPKVRGGGASAPQQSSGPTKSPLERSSETIVLQVDRARKDLEAFDAKVAAAGGAAPGAQTSGSGTAPLAVSLLDNPKIRIWAHDVNVEQGKTYRYRVRIAVNNPLFGRTASLKPEQAKLAQEAVSLSDWSEWSDEITVDPTEFYFVTSASERDNLGPTRASAELYKFYYGYYRRGTVTVEPGDTLAAEMKLPDGLRLFDLAKLATSNPGLAPVPEAVPTPGRSNDEGGRGGRFVRPQPVGTPDRSATEAGRPAPNAPAATANTPPADGLWKPAPKSMKMAVDALLLDVGPVALAQQTGLGSKSEQITQAFLRVSDGAIQVRVPRQDQADPAYQRLRRNAEAGEQAAKPKDETPGGTNVPPPPPPPGPGDVRPSPPGGGGGGGAGGG